MGIICMERGATLYVLCALGYIVLCALGYIVLCAFGYIVLCALGYIVLCALGYTVLCALGYTGYLLRYSSTAAFALPLQYPYT